MLTEAKTVPTATCRPYSSSCSTASPGLRSSASATVKVSLTSEVTVPVSSAPTPTLATTGQYELVCEARVCLYVTKLSWSVMVGVFWSVKRTRMSEVEIKSTPVTVISVPPSTLPRVVDSVWISAL